MNIQELPTRQDLLDLETRLIGHIEKLLRQAPVRGQRQWLRSKEVRDMLNISPGTLKNLRLSGALPYTRIGATILYDQESVDRILEKNRVEYRMPS